MSKISNFGRKLCTIPDIREFPPQNLVCFGNSKKVWRLEMMIPKQKAQAGW